MGLLEFEVTIDQNNLVSSAAGLQMVIYTDTGEFAAAIPYAGGYRVLHGRISRKAGYGLGYCPNGAQTATVRLQDL
jgi:hypothetical protein